MSAAENEAYHLFNPRQSTRPHPEDEAEADHDSPTPDSPHGSPTRSPSRSTSSNQITRGQSNKYPNYRSNSSVRVDASHYSYSDAQTGPKGVLADARAYERAWRAQQSRQNSTTQGGNTGGGGAWPFQRETSSRKTGRRDDSRSPDASADRDGHREGMGMGMGMIEEDQEFMEHWRVARLNELRSGGNRTPANAGNGSRNGSRSTVGRVGAGGRGDERGGGGGEGGGRRYGFMEKVDGVGYLDAIETAGRDTVVVVCVGDDEVWILYFSIPFH